MTPAHMIPRISTTAVFKCPACKTRQRWHYYTSYTETVLDVSSCMVKWCAVCKIKCRLPCRETQCLECERRVECLPYVIVPFVEGVKFYNSRISTFAERMDKVRERGFARVTKEGNIHKVLGKFHGHKTRTAKQLRHSRMTMWEVMYALVYGFIEHFGRMSIKGSFYQLTEVGLAALGLLDSSPKKKGQIVEVPAELNEYWVSYFRIRQW